MATENKPRGPKPRPIEIAQYAAIRTLVRQNLHRSIQPLISYRVVQRELQSSRMPTIKLGESVDRQGNQRSRNGDWTSLSSVKTTVDYARRASRRRGKDAKSWWVDSVIDRMIAIDLTLRVQPAHAVLRNLLASPAEPKWDEEIPAAAETIFREGTAADEYGITRTGLMPFRAMRVHRERFFNDRHLSAQWRQQRDDYEYTWTQVLSERYRVKLIASLTIRELLTQLSAIEDGFCLLVASNPDEFNAETVARWFAAAVHAYLTSVVEPAESHTS